MNRLFPSLAIGIVLAACSGRDVTAPVTAAPVVPAAAARVARVTLSPGTVTLPIGTVQDLFVTLTGADGALLADRQVTWTTSDESVAIASALVVTGPPSSGRQPVGVVSAFHAGTATITGAIDGQSGSMTITVVAPTTSKSVVVIDSFTVVEFQYPSAPGQWYYAPLVRLKETTGLHGASVIGVDFSIPGFGPAPKCRAGLYLGPGESADLFHEIYGDYQLEYSNGGARATGSEATALITVQDDAGVVALLTALGPIVPGRLPTTYTGGNPVNHLACGP